MTDDETGFRIEVYGHDLDPEEKAELNEVVSHALAGDFIAIFDGISSVDAEDMDRLQAVVDDIRDRDSEASL